VTSGSQRGLSLAAGDLRHRRFRTGRPPERRKLRRSATTRRARCSATRRRWRWNMPTQSPTRAGTSTTRCSCACSSTTTNASSRFNRAFRIPSQGFWKR
jgi:hypothetical protein